MVDQILFIESPDEQSVYRCVSGMPLNFVLSIDTFGNKAASESQGGASVTSFAFDFAKITNLTTINIPSSFLYGTARDIRVITLDYNSTIFGEPTFIVSAIIDAGIVNNYSLVEINGDYAFIDAEGAKTFNAVKQLKWEGRNSNFSSQLSRLLEYTTGKPIKQIESIAFNFNNYAIFALQSRWGFLYFVYDTMSEKWVAIDSLHCGKLKRVTFTDTALETKLYGINISDEVWWLYADTANKEVAILTTRAYASKTGRNYYEDNLKIQHKSESLRLGIKNGINSGTIFATEYVDKQRSSIDQSSPLKSVVSGINYPIQSPVTPNNAQLDEHKTFTWRDGLQGRKIHYVLKWDTDAVLSELQLTTIETSPDNAAPQSNQPIESTYGS